MRWTTFCHCLGTTILERWYTHCCCCCYVLMYMSMVGLTIVVLNCDLINYPVMYGSLKNKTKSALETHIMHH